MCKFSRNFLTRQERREKGGKEVRLELRSLVGQGGREARNTSYSGKEGEICRSGSRDSEANVKGCSRGTLVANALAGQVEG